MNITFIEYKEEHKDLLLDLFNKLKTYGKSLDPLHRTQNLPGFVEASLKETSDNVKKYQGKIWLAQYNSEVIGFIIGAIWEQSDLNRLEIGKHKLGEVTNIYLEDKYRGKGLGKKMFQMMEKYFKEKGCDSVWVSVSAPNEHAHNTYKKFGFMDREVGMLKQI